MLKSLGHLINSLCAVAVVCITAEPAFAQVSVNEWVIEQNFVDRGRLTLYVAHDAVKVVSPDWGYQMVAKAPTWEVHCFRQQQKIEWVGLLDHFAGCMLIDPVGMGQANETRLFVVGKGTEQGLNYVKYSTSAHSISAIYGATDIPVGARVCEFIARFYEMPNCGKVPLYCSQDKGKGKAADNNSDPRTRIDLGRDLRSGLVVFLTTKSWTCKAFDAHDFDLPQGYKRLKYLTQVGYSDKQKEALTDVLDNMGFESEPARNHGRTSLGQKSDSTVKKSN